VASRRLTASLQRLGTSGRVVPYEGAYLYVCAEYELAVRQLLEDFGSQAPRKVRRYENLPEKLRARHLACSAQILNDIGPERFTWLSPEDIVAKLHSCLDPSTRDFE